MTTAKTTNLLLAEAANAATDQPCLWLSFEIRRPGHVNALAARYAR
jgi:hypothetical protein